MTKTNKIGYIGSFQFRSDPRHQLCLYPRKSEPRCRIQHRVGYMVDPAKEADAANALIEQGCDVVLQHTD